MVVARVGISRAYYMTIKPTEEAVTVAAAGTIRQGMSAAFDEEPGLDGSGVEEDWTNET